MSKHTPGPWDHHVDNQSEYTHTITAVSRPATSPIIADVVKHPSSEANARLIAAAPDLLEALLAVASMPPDDEGDLPPIPWVQQPDFAPSQYKLANQMRAAIAKATEEPTPEQ